MLVETRVAPSLIHGLGLFAVKAIPRNTPIWTFQAGFDREFSPEQFAALPPLAQRHTRWFSFVSMVDGHRILSGDHACFMNHAAEPNTGAPLEAKLPVTTVALRDIAAGEEITCSYFDFDAEAQGKLGSESNAPPGAK